MRGLIAVLFVAFGWVADRSVRAERHLKEDALRLNRLLQFLGQIKHDFERPIMDAPSAASPQQRAAQADLPQHRTGAAENGSDVAQELEDLALDAGDIGRLARALAALII